MAGDWIPMRIDLRDDPAVIAIASATGLDEDAVAGKLLRLWGWANRQLTNGCATSATDSWVDRFLSAPGFAAAMLSAGWLATRSGQLHFPKFERWNSQGAKRRVLAAERMRRSRDAKRDAGSATQAQPKKRREENREENKTSPPSGETELPDILSTDAFREAWQRWVEDRAKRRLKKLTPAGIATQLRRLAEIGPEKAIECIEASIANGWQGLFPDRFKPNAKTGFQTHDDRVGDVLFGGFDHG